MEVRNDGGAADVFVKPKVVINGGETKDDGDVMHHMESGGTTRFDKDIPIPPGARVTSCDASA